MRLKIADVSKFISGVKALSGNANVLGIMLEAKEGGASLVFSDSKKALYKDIEADVSEDEVGKCYVIEFSTLNDGISKVQSSGNIKCTDIDLDLSGVGTNEIIKASSDKFMTYQVGDDVEDKKISTIEFLIKAYLKENAGSKYGNLTRFDYQNIMFSNTEEDSWDRLELLDLIKKLSKGDDGKAAYVSPKKKAGFIVNKTSLFYINCDVNIGFTANKQVIKGLLEVINKYDNDTLNVSVTDRKYCSIHTDGFGIWFEMAPYKEIDGTMLNNYEKNSAGEDREYTDIEILLNKEATLDMIKASQIGNKNDSSVLNIDYSNSELVFGSEKTGQSSLDVQIRHKEDKEKSTLGIVYKVWEDILNNCDGVYIKLGIDIVDEKSVYLRFSDLTEDGESRAVMYTLATERN
jgi:hypothetical protein